MNALLSAGLAMLVLCAPAWAESWVLRNWDSGALYHGSAMSPDGWLGFSCTAPSPQGRPLIETGDHESNRTDDPHRMIVGLDTEFVDPFTTPPLLAYPSIVADGTAYPLPPAEYSDFYGEWSIRLPLTDPVFDALLRARTLAFRTGRGGAQPFPAEGMARALQGAVAHCLTGWELQGVVTPTSLTRWKTPPAPAPGDAFATTAQALFSPAEERARARVALACGGAAEYRAGTIVIGEVDGDGRFDTMLDWSGVRCLSGPNSTLPGAGNCGASQCLYDFFLAASPDSAEPDHGFLAQGVRFVPGQPGRIEVGVRLGLCRELNLEPTCRVMMRWTGDRFAPE